APLPHADPVARPARGGRDGGAHHPPPDRGRPAAAPARRPPPRHPPPPRQRLAAARLSPPSTFSSALFILLREGLEPILVLAALVAMLIKSGRREALRYVHAGWIVALALVELTCV